MKKIILIYGTIAGLIVIGMLLITFSSSMVDFENGEILGYSSMIIAFSTIFFAIKNYRDKHLNGSIGFGKAFKIGFGISMVATILYTASWMIMSETIAQDFMNQYYQYSLEQLKASDLSEAEINAKIQDMDDFKELYKNPIVKIGMTFLEILPVGILISLVSALILKTKTIKQTT